jgi:hypothetical protein
MNIPQTIPELTALFEKLGAKDPSGWATSQITEGIPQLHRFLFLRQCWSHIIEEKQVGWIDYHIRDAEENPQGSYAGMGAALKRAVAAGVSRHDLAEVARGVQAELLSQLCYLLDDNGLAEPVPKGVGWGLFQTDDDGNAIAPIYSLHESVLDTDPTGREMKPTAA